MFKNIIKGPRRSGKSTALIQLVVVAALGDSKRLLVVSPQYEMNRYLYHICLRLLKDEVIRCVTSPIYEIELTNGHRIRFLSATQKTYHGEPVDLIAIDEHTFIPQEFKDAIIPCLSWQPNATLWMTELEDAV